MILRVSWLLARPSATGLAASALPIIAFGVVTALLLSVLAGAQAFWSWTDEEGQLYQLLAMIALALLVVPLLTLGGSAARLSARRRDDRLATLRLLGASGRTVAALTVLESTAQALLGALAGILGYVALVPLLGLLQFRGAPLSELSLWLPIPVIVFVVLGVGLLAATSAVVGLRGVIISPLGVRTKQSAPKQHWIRVLVGVGVVIATFAAMSVLQGDIVIIMVVLGIGFGGTLAVLNLVGPFLIRMVARRQARRANTAVRLLAARSVLESPKAAWRQVGGVAMTSFMAVFVGVGLAVADFAASSTVNPADLVLLQDIRTGVLITVVISFVMVACSVGVNQAAGVLDRRDLYVSLDRLGMPIRAMDASRSRAVMSPLLVVVVWSTVTAAIVVFPLTGMALLVKPLALVTIAACIAGGVAVVWLGLRATRTVLVRAVRQPERV